MNTQSERTSLIQSESGQAAAFVALLLFFVFLGFAALAIDGAMTYSVRRNLQNVADASALAGCRVLANGGAASDALIEAENTISNNLGAWIPFVGSNPPSTNIGIGDGLVFGIEVPGSPGTNVRVAVMRQVPTVLTQFFGRPQTEMNAKARCDSTAGGGLLPIAIQRYDGGTGGTMVDYLAKPGAPLYPSDSVTVTIPYPPARYSPYFKVPVPCGNPPNLPDSSTGSCAGLNYFASDSAVPGVPDANSGITVTLVGQSANTNNNPNGFNSFVLLDIRNVGGNVLEAYNGATGQQNTDKNISQGWIYQHGYPGPFPAVGSEIAVLDGVSASFAPQAVQKSGYNIGDAIAAIVYDGYSWTKPSYAVKIQPVTSADGLVSGRAVTYTVSAWNNTNVPWPGGMMNFNLSLGFSQQPIAANTHVAWMGTELTPSAGYYPFAMWDVIDGTTGNGQLTIWNDTLPITSTVTYLSGLNLIASNGILIQGAASNFGIGSPPVLPDDYTIRTDSGKVFILQGASTTANLISYGIGSAFPSGNGNPGCDAQVKGEVYLNGFPQTPWSNYFGSTPQFQTIRIKQGVDKALAFSLSAPNGATTGSYTLRFTVQSPCGNNSITQRYVEMPLEIDTATNVSANRFVFIQGYAIFRISYFDANDVIGYAISPLYPSLDQIKVGLQPRLVPW